MILQAAFFNIVVKYMYFIMILQAIAEVMKPVRPFPLLEWGGDARTRDECQARGAGRAGPACPPSVRPSVR